MTTPTQDDLISLPLAWLGELITGIPPDHLFCCKVRSRLPNVPDPHPRVVRYEIGVILRERDPGENKFKVHLYPDTKHAEVWDIHEWHGSTSRLFTSRAESVEYNNTVALEERKTIILTNWLIRRWHIDSPRTARPLAEALLKTNDSDIKRMFLSGTTLEEVLKDV